MALPVISYRVFDGRDGLDIRGNELVAFFAGQPVHAVEISAAADLDLLLRTYTVPKLMPDLTFCYSRHQVFEVLIDFLDSDPVRQEVQGSIVFEGKRYGWSAKMRVHPDFAEEDLIPEEQRSWMRRSDVEKSRGLEFYLPSVVRDHNDPVVTKRCALALAGFVGALRDGYELNLPQVRQFDNLFSSEFPMWAANLPRVADGAPAEHRAFAF